MAEASERPYNPRASALGHAYTAAVGYGMRQDADGIAGDAVQAIAAGLVYVGDQITALIDRIDVRDPAWREFLSEQAQQIPAGVEAAVRELLEQLEGQSLEFEMREPVASLTDWLNQLGNVREAIVDERAGE